MMARRPSLEPVNHGMKAIRERHQKEQERLQKLEARHAELRRSSTVHMMAAHPSTGNLAKVQSDRAWAGGLSRRRSIDMDRTASTALPLSSSAPALMLPPRVPAEESRRLQRSLSRAEHEVTFPVTGQRWRLRPCDAPRPLDKVLTHGNSVSLPQWNEGEAAATRCAGQLRTSVPRAGFTMARVVAPPVQPSPPDKRDMEKVRMMLRSPATQYRRMVHRRDPITVRSLAMSELDGAEVTGVHALADHIPKLGEEPLRRSWNVEAH